MRRFEQPGVSPVTLRSPRGTRGPRRVSESEIVVPGLVPGTPIRREQYPPDRDSRDEPGHDNRDLQVLRGPAFGRAPQDDGMRRAAQNLRDRTIDIEGRIPIIGMSCSSRGVDMGRREDGAAAREGRRCGPSSPGRPSGEIPPSADAAPRVRANVAFHSRAMAGLRSQAIGPAARSWLTGVAGPRSRKRGPHIDRTPHVERREAPLFFGREGTPSQSVPPDGFARHPSGVSQNPRVCRRSAPLEKGA